MTVDNVPGAGSLSANILWHILESVNDAVITIDETHKVRFMNRTAEKMFGYDRHEALGRDLTIFLPATHHKLHCDSLDRYLSQHMPPIAGKIIECSGRRKDGSFFPLEKSYSYLETDGHRFYTAIIRDITKRKELEQQVSFTERLADVGKAITHVVHEIRTPLMLIGGFARQVERSAAMAQDDRNRRKLNIIAEEIKRLEELLESIRLLRRPAGASRKGLVDMHELLRTTCDLFEPQLKRQRVALETRMAPGVMQVDADPDQLKQVFLNLLQNALEALDGPGAIVIETRFLAGAAELTIHDSGPGIPEEVRDRVFDSFFTTKTQGTGLGLAIIRNIIRDHGGTIRLRSEPGQGTDFIIELPLEDPLVRLEDHV